MTLIWRHILIILRQITSPASFRRQSYLGNLSLNWRHLKRCTYDVINLTNFNKRLLIYFLERAIVISARGSLTTGCSKKNYVGYRLPNPNMDMIIDQYNPIMYSNNDVWQWHLLTATFSCHRKMSLLLCDLLDDEDLIRDKNKMSLRRHHVICYHVSWCMLRKKINIMPPCSVVKKSVGNTISILKLYKAVYSMMRIVHSKIYEFEIIQEPFLEIFY